MSDLLDLLDWTDAPEWEPIYKTYDLAGMIADDRCRDCGRKAAYNQGGANRLGSFMVCDGCAQIDGCSLQVCNPYPVWCSDRGTRIELAAMCEDCPWWLDAKRWDDDGEWVLLTPEEVADMVAEHATPRHVSRWGMTHPPGKHDDLVRAQGKRRADYLRRAA